MPEFDCEMCGWTTAPRKKGHSCCVECGKSGSVADMCENSPQQEKLMLQLDADGERGAKHLLRRRG